jgi:hypothetical protein
MLQQFQFQDDGTTIEIEIAAVDLDHRRPPDVRSDQALDSFDALTVYQVQGCLRSLRLRVGGQLLTIIRHMANWQYAY